jgi:tripartite-type tricarboxylate transporter receptor subunit TctC
MSRVAWAQSYPARTVRIMVGFAAGGTADILARLMGQWLSERLGRQFVVENRPGAGSNIATEAVVRASPDGHTLLLVAGAQTVNATLYDKLNFNFIGDIAPVASISLQTSVMVVNPSFPAKTLPEFIAYAKANPGNPRSTNTARDLHRVKRIAVITNWVRRMSECGQMPLDVMQAFRQYFEQDPMVAEAVAKAARKQS